MNDATRYNLLIEFNDGLALSTCENIVQQMDEVIDFAHDDIEERYDTEDKAYRIIMRLWANAMILERIEKYLDGKGLRNRYEVYQRLSN